jgi:hypothetical protein
MTYRQGEGHKHTHINRGQAYLDFTPTNSHKDLDPHPWKQAPLFVKIKSPVNICKIQNLAPYA